MTSTGHVITVVRSKASGVGGVSISVGVVIRVHGLSALMGGGEGGRLGSVLADVMC